MRAGNCCGADAVPAPTAGHAQPLMGSVLPPGWLGPAQCPSSASGISGQNTLIPGFFQLALPGIEHGWGVPELGRGEHWASVTQGSSLTLEVAHLWSSSVAQRTRWELA